MTRANPPSLPVLLTPTRPALEPLPSVSSILRSRALIALLAFGFALSCGMSVALSAGAAQPAPSIFDVLLKWAPLIGSGFLFNIAVSIASMAIGTASGILLGLGQISPSRSTAKISWFLTQFFRNSPWLVLLFFAMFLLPFDLKLGSVTIPLPA